MTMGMGRLGYCPRGKGLDLILENGYVTLVYRVFHFFFFFFIIYLIKEPDI